MTPADFDRPYVDEAHDRFVEQTRTEPARAENRTEPESRRESQAEPQPAGEAPHVSPDHKHGDDKPTDDKSSGERKRGGWWKRVLS